MISSAPVKEMRIVYADDGVTETLPVVRARLFANNRGMGWWVTATELHGPSPAFASCLVGFKDVPTDIPDCADRIVWCDAIVRPRFSTVRRDFIYDVVAVRLPDGDEFIENESLNQN